MSSRAPAGAAQEGPVSRADFLKRLGIMGGAVILATTFGSNVAAAPTAPGSTTITDSETQLPQALIGKLRTPIIEQANALTAPDLAGLDGEWRVVKDAVGKYSLQIYDAAAESGTGAWVGVEVIK